MNNGCWVLLPSDLPLFDSEFWEHSGVANSTSHLIQQAVNYLSWCNFGACKTTCEFRTDMLSRFAEHAGKKYGSVC